VDETVAGDSTDDAHGEAMARAAGLVREDNPEFDEALDPEFEPVFEVEIDPALEERDIHEADDDPERGGDIVNARAERTIPGMGGKVFDFRGTGLCPF